MSLTREQQELLEAYGFDLMAQVEGILRHVRQYQQALQRFRGTLPSTHTRQPIAVMAEHARALRRALREFDTVLTDIEESTSSASERAAQGQQNTEKTQSDSEPA